MAGRCGLRSRDHDRRALRSREVQRSAGQYGHLARLPAPNLVKAAVEGRLPRGIGIERLRDPPTEWSRQFEALGLNPE